MRRVLVDDQLLGQLLRGRRPRGLARAEVYTTGYWYVRLCQAVLGAAQRPGVLAGPFTELPPAVRERAVGALLELPDDIGLISLRTLGPTIGRLRGVHSLNILGLEALAAAGNLDAAVWLSAPSPRLQTALEQEGRTVRLVP